MAPKTISEELELAVPAPRLWKAIKDNEFLPKAVPHVKSVEVVKGEPAEPVVGDIRVLHFDTAVLPFPSVKEQLTYLDEAKMTVKSKTLEGALIGSQVNSHCATLSVKPKGDKACIVSWTAEYDPVVDKPEIVESIKQSFIGTFKPAEAYLLSSSEYN